MFGTFRHITVLPSQGSICGEAPRPIQTVPPWIAAEITAISNFLVNLSSEHVVFMGTLCIPLLASVTGNCGVYVTTVTTSISIVTVCNKECANCSVTSGEKHFFLHLELISQLKLGIVGQS